MFLFKKNFSNMELFQPPEEDLFERRRLFQPPREENLVQEEGLNNAISVFFVSSVAINFKDIFKSKFNNIVFKYIKMAFENLKIRLFKNTENFKTTMVTRLGLNADVLKDNSTQWEYLFVKYLKRSILYDWENNRWQEKSPYNLEFKKDNFFNENIVTYFHYKCMLETFYNYHSYTDYLIYFYKNSYEFCKPHVKEYNISVGSYHSYDDKRKLINYEIRKNEFFYKMYFFDVLINFISQLHSSRELTYPVEDDDYRKLFDLPVVVLDHVGKMKETLVKPETLIIKKTQNIFFYDKDITIIEFFDIMNSVNLRYERVNNRLTEASKMYYTNEISAKLLPVCNDYKISSEIFISPPISAKLCTLLNRKFVDIYEKHMNKKKEFIANRMKL